MKKAIISVIGKDKVGIIYGVTKILSENHIYKTSFSKYGTVYREHIYPKIMEENKNA